MGGGARPAVVNGVILESAQAVTVRPAESRDVTRVAEIERTAFADPWSDAAFVSSLSLPHIRFLVADSGGAAGPASHGPAAGASVVVGYVLAMILGPEGEIADIAVASDARGRGIGGLLLDQILVDLRRAGVRTVYLEVRESNEAARRLYESRQFGHVGRRRGYYQHPVEDALVLRREFGTT